MRSTIETYPKVIIYHNKIHSQISRFKDFTFHVSLSVMGFRVMREMHVHEFIAITVFCSPCFLRIVEGDFCTQLEHLSANKQGIFVWLLIT